MKTKRRAAMIKGLTTVLLGVTIAMQVAVITGSRPAPRTVRDHGNPDGSAGFLSISARERTRLIGAATLGATVGPMLNEVPEGFGANPTVSEEGHR